MTIQDIYILFRQSKGVVIDSRKIESGVMYVSIKGQNFDGNTFAREAIEQGAAYAVIDNKGYYVDERTILVEDCLVFLQKLAQYHRVQLGLPVLALTGSNGKTTTKELISRVLAKKFKTKATVGNLNNHIGVPLTLLSLTSDEEFAVIEMGANHKKEIQILCDIALPNYGYITNFGKAHLEGFGGFEGVIEGKSELYDYFRKYKSAEIQVFVNKDDQLQLRQSFGLNAFTFSESDTLADYVVDKVQLTPFITIDFEGMQIVSHLIGWYNVPNILSAIAIGRYFGVGTNQIKEAIEGYIPENNRTQLIIKGTNKVLLDAYNANPSSMKAAIDNFLQIDVKSKMIFLGDMFELGAESNQEHKCIVEMLDRKDDVLVYFVGNHFYKHKKESSNMMFFENFDQIKEHLSDKIINEKSILIKGSRGMALERLLEAIRFV
ncbi:MAG: UDP-N-acetylmuramoyl-tripeptide--D-alanyl-D-alanine ligase [Bacteroidota bacterium]|nr:UDP-N-acetylmuramoyl-tripeptide--D-alanyl-D-alanine ligase [Bacteroidota bacterium]